MNQGKWFTIKKKKLKKFSKYVDRQLRDDILQHTMFMQIDSLGKYMGENIALVRTTKEKFQHNWLDTKLIDCVEAPVFEFH